MASPNPASPNPHDTPTPHASHASPPFSSSYETPPTFTPFFTLIANPASTVHKHPIVHYVFSDDDFDPVTETALQEESKPGRQSDRVVVVDIGSDGETVVAAHSLSKEWQVVGVDTAPAPQWMATPEDGGVGSGVAPNGGLMLTIEGTEMVGLQGLRKTESVYELAKVFSERMALIKRVIEYGEKSPAA